MKRRVLRPFAGLALVALLASPRSASAQPAHAEIVPPRPITHVDAIYPNEAIAKGAHGEVVLAVTVDADGHVKDVEIIDSAGKLLDAAAVRAVSEWTFAPATRNGTPVAAKIRVPFHFAPPSELSHDAVAPGPPAPAPAAANSPDEAPSPAAATHEGDTSTVRVIGHTRPPSRGASDFNIRVGELARVPRANAGDMLKLAPGVLLTNEGGDGHAQQVFMRGFDAREGQDLEFSVGGVPINDAGNLHGNGYADTHFILPELVESLRVVEGPFDPRQGNFAVAGSADYELGLAKRGLTAKYTHGSFATQRMLLLWGPQGETTHTFGGAELYKTDGFGQNRDSRRATAMGQYEGRVGSRGLYRITATAHTTAYHSAGVLRDDDVSSGKKGFFDTYDFGQGGASSRYMIAGDFETRTGSTFFRNQIFVTLRSMRIRENFTGFLLDPQEPLQSPHGQRGDLLDLDMSSTTIGAKGFARARTEAFGHPQELELGYFARGDQVTNTQQRIEAATSHPYRTENDVEAKIGDIGLYGDANLRATKWISLRGGLRADLFTYDVNDKCAVGSVAHPSRTNPPGDASCLSQQDFGAHREPNQRADAASTALMPRGTLLVGPFDKFTFSASAGRGVRSIDPTYITQDASTPFASVAAYEGAVTWAGSLGNSVELTARSIFFETLVDRDLVFNETAGRNVLGGGTTRTGWVGALRLNGAWFDESANVTLVRSSFDDTHLLVPYVPDVVVRSDTAFFAPLPFKIAGEPVKGSLGLGTSYVGRRALPYGQRSDSVFTLDTSASLAWSAYELTLTGTNLFDQKYRLGEYNFASDFRSQGSATLVPARHFAAGTPRAVFITFGVTLGGAG